MVTVSFAANLRGSAGSAASRASASSAPLVIPREARNLLFADSVAALPLSHAAPAPPAACRINSLRFITPPLCFSALSRSLLWTPRLASRLSLQRRHFVYPAPRQWSARRRPPSYARCKSLRHTAPPLPFRPGPYDSVSKDLPSKFQNTSGAAIRAI